jgi:hypothetical protein
MKSLISSMGIPSRKEIQELSNESGCPQQENRPDKGEAICRQRHRKKVEGSEKRKIGPHGLCNWHRSVRNSLPGQVSVSAGLVFPIARAMDQT